MFAPVGLLASVGTIVNSQCASLNECLGAASVCAIVRSFIGVYSEVTLEVGFAIEALVRQNQFSVPTPVGQGVQSTRMATIPWDNPPTSIQRDGLIVSQQELHVLKRFLSPYGERQCSVGGVWCGPRHGASWGNAPGLCLLTERVIGEAGPL